MSRVLVGGVGYRWAKDGSLGLLAAEALGRERLPRGIESADLGYGAIQVAQDLGAATPPYSALVLLAARQRGRVPGTIERSEWDGRSPAAETLQEMVREAGAGIVDLDHLLAVGAYLGALPRAVTLILVEPFEVGPGEPSARGAELLPRLVAMARESALERAAAAAA